MLKHRWSLGHNYLAGISAGDWWRLLRENQFAVDAAYWHRAAFITLASIVNSYFRQRYEHQFLYDWTTMEKMLRQAGFTRVLRATFGKTESFQPIALDDKKYGRESLYVEAFKH